MSDLKILDIKDLQKVCKKSKIKYGDDTPKEQLVKLIQTRFKEIDSRQITKVKKLGVEGKDGTVWLIKYKPTISSKPKEYALKQFKSRKSSGEIQREAELQIISSKVGISPRVIEVDILSKYIIMEYIEGDSLFDTLKKSNGAMSIHDQINFVKVIDKLDEIGVYHGDPSPLNFMYDKNKNLKIIDFGFGKKMDNTDPNKNRKSMLLGFILKMKQIGVNVDKNYSYIKKHIDSEDLKQCGISY